MVSPAQVIGMTLTFMVGLVVYAYYAETGCDPIRGGLVDNSNQVFNGWCLSICNLNGSYLSLSS